MGDEVLGLRHARGGRTKGVHQLRLAQIARAYQGVRAPASEDNTPLMRQYARLFGKDKAAAAWAWPPKAPAAAAAYAAVMREEEQLFSKDKEAASFIKDKEAASLSLLKSCFAEARTALVKDREAASWQPMMGAGPWIPRTTALPTNRMPPPLQQRQPRTRRSGCAAAAQSYRTCRTCWPTGSSPRTSTWPRSSASSRRRTVRRLACRCWRPSLCRCGRRSV